MKEDRLNISAYIRNPFNHYLNFNSKTVTTDFMTNSSDKDPMRRFGVSVSYRIGKLQARVKKAERSIENDDVKSGSGQSSQGVKQ